MTEPALEGALRAIAAYGLSTDAPPLPAPLDDDRFTILLNSCEHHRLLGLLGAATNAGHLPVTGEQRARLEHGLQAWLAHGLRVEALVLAATAALDTAAIEHRMLKGVALAHTVYPDPAWRVFADADVLVRADAFTHSVDVLCDALHGRRAVPELRPGWDARFGREALVHVDGLELDLHRTLVDGAYGLTIDLDELIAGARTFRLGGTEMQMLGAAQAFVQACYSAVLGDWPPRLMAQRDVAQILDTLSPDIDEVRDLARRWRGTAVVARGIAEAWAALGLETKPALAAWAHRYRAGPFDRLLLASYRGANRGPTSQAAGALVVPGIGGKLAYARGIAFPKRAYLEARGLDRRRFARRALGR